MIRAVRLEAGRAIYSAFDPLSHATLESGGTPVRPIAAAFQARGAPAAGFDPPPSVAGGGSLLGVG